MLTIWMHKFFYAWANRDVDIFLSNTMTGIVHIEIRHSNSNRCMYHTPIQLNPHLHFSYPKSLLHCWNKINSKHLFMPYKFAGCNFTCENNNIRLPIFICVVSSRIVAVQYIWKELSVLKAFNKITARRKIVIEILANKTDLEFYY